MKKKKPFYRRVIQYVTRRVGRGFRLIVSLFPRNKRLIIYGGALDLFIDNAKYFFIIAQEVLPEYQHIWLTKNRKTFDTVKEYGFDVVFSNSLKGIWYILRAGSVIYDNKIREFSYYNLSQGTLNIDMWHGIGFKHCGTPMHNGLKYYMPKKKFRETFMKEHEHGDYLVCPSLRHFTFFSDSFQIPQENIILSDYPRNLILLSTEEKRINFIKKYETPQYLDLYLSIKSSKCKNIIYMPTFRDGNPSYINTAFPNWDQFNDFCKQSNIIIYLKLHRVTPFPKKFSYSNIVLLDNSMDIYPLLPVFDMLVTDYSSIMYDFALLKKPIVLYAFDLEDYIANSRNLFQEEWQKVYQALTVVKNYTELKSILKQSSNTISTLLDVYACPGNIDNLIGLIRNRCKIE